MSDNKNNTGDWNSGNHNTGHFNTGYRNTGDRNTGDRNTGDWNTGDRNTGNGNTGNFNTGNFNTGNRNTGNRNTGGWNTGDWNTGNGNTGNGNTGYRNTGDRNTGDWNTIDRSTGYFNTVQEHIVMVFNKPMLYSDFHKLDLPSFLFFSLVEFVQSSEMTDEEKEENPTHETTGGYLKTLEYKDAFRKSYDEASQEDRDKIKAIPGFDADVFLEISGIDVRTYKSKEVLDEIAELEARLKELKG